MEVAEIEFLRFKYPQFFDLLREATDEGVTFLQTKSGALHAAAPPCGMTMQRFVVLTTELSKWEGLLKTLSTPPVANLRMH